MSGQVALVKTGQDVQHLAKQFEFAEDFVQTVKDTFAKGATDNELKLFLQTAKRTGNEDSQPSAAQSPVQPTQAAKPAATAAKKEMSPLDTELLELCNKLNAAFVTDTWNGSQIIAYAQNHFEGEEIKAWKDLTDEHKNILIGDLTETLNERLAIIELNESENVIDGEVAEVAPEPDFASINRGTK